MMYFYFLLCLTTICFVHIQGYTNLKKTTEPANLSDDDTETSNEQDPEIEVQKPSRRIVGGKTATPHQFPYQAYITFNNEIYCGASIIDQHWALTAAHCVDKDAKDNAKLIVGTNRINGADGKHYKIDNFTVHPGFNHIPEELNGGLEFVANDIALIHITRSIIFNDAVQPVKLPRIGQTFENQSATVAGWGKTLHYLSKTDNLQYATVRVLTQQECSAVWTYVVNSHICTSTERFQSVCTGDSGGPLVVNGVQIGIVSTADTYCEFKKPNLYTNVASYVHWIKKHMHNL